MNLLKINFHVNNKLIKKINNDNDELQKINEKNNKNYYLDLLTFSRIKCPFPQHHLIIFIYLIFHLI